MKITKFGHCCLLIEEKGLRILTDPGNYTEAQNDLENLDILIITHEHSDHFHAESVKKVLENNPNVKIITNPSVDNLLKDLNILNVEIISHGEEKEILGINVKGFGEEHALIHKEWNTVENTGYFIGDRLFYPGDALTIPDKKVDILALPVSGPWLKISEVIDYCIEIAPTKAFPVHDGGLNERGLGFNKRVSPIILEKHNIKLIDLPLGVETEM